MEVAPNSSSSRKSLQPAGSAAPLPYDPLLSGPALSSSTSAPDATSVDPNSASSMQPQHSLHQQQQITPNPNPVSMDTPTETPHDLFCLAREYERRGRLQDAANLYLKASMNGHLSAMVAYATQLVPTDERAAFVWFRAAAERGDPRAWYELGQLLARGRYFEVNAVDAARCWKRAAQMGDNTGKSALGLCYIRGFGVKQDLEKGVEIVRQVADVHNDVTAMKNLAWIFRYGKGVPKDLQEAEYWDNRAKEQEKVMLHISSREQVLFGRRSSRHSKHNKPRDGEKSTSRPATRENSISERASTPDPESSRQARGRVRQLKVDELEGRLRDVSEERNVQSSARSAASDDAASSLRERSYSPNPLRGTHLPETFVGDTQRSSSVPEDTESRSHPLRDSSYGTTRLADPRSSTEIEPRPLSSRNHSKDSSMSKRDDESNAMPGRLSTGSTGLQSEEEHDHQVLGEPILGQRSSKNWTAQSVTSVNPVQQEKSSPSIERAAQLSPVSSKRASANHNSSHTQDPSEEQFITPEESFDNLDNAHDKHSAHPSTAPAVGIANRENLNDENIKKISVEGEKSGLRNYTPGVDDLNDLLPNQKSVVQPTSVRPSDNLGERGSSFVAHPPQQIAPAVLSRKKFFESDEEREAILNYDDTEQSMKGYPNPVDSDMKPSDDDQAELDEFEDADIQRFNSAAADVGGSVEDEPVARSLTPTIKDEVTSTAATQDTELIPQKTGAVETKSNGPTIDNEGLRRLEELLKSYPSNPMRADSQPTLKILLNAIQDYAVTNAEAQGVIERGLGYYKVVVAMISQQEDEQIQELGLHCLVRIIRALPSNLKEATIMASYADCFRIVQDNRDVIVPRGSGRVVENVSGSIQAIVHSMRNHATVRRIQLAGCAALSEVASASGVGRATAFEFGASSLLLACIRHRSSQAAAVIHEMAGRAISNFCSGKENTALKEAFTNAGSVTELLSVLQLWGHNEHATSEMMISATLSCCSGLRHVTDGYGPACIQCVQSFAYHILIRIMVLHRDDVTICIVVLSALTAITRGAGPPAEKALLDAKPLPEVLSTMQIHSENALFIRKALDFMEALGSFSAMREEIVVAGGIPFSADIIKQGGNDSLLLERACGVVEKLCRGSAPNQDIFLSNDGIRSVASILRSHLRQPGVIERALLAIHSVCLHNPASQQEAIRASAPEELVHVLSFYSAKNAKVVAACSSAISSLVMPKNVPMAQTFAGLKAPELIVRTMKRHPDSVTVQENGSSAVAACCEADPHIMTSLLKSGICNVLIVALQRFLHKKSTVVQVVRAMRAIINEAVPEDSYRFKNKLLTDRSNESSLPEIFHTALSYHKKSLPETESVIISICATINRLCMRSATFKNAMGKDGIVEELKRLVERTVEYKNLGALQPVLATICTLVLESEENKNRFHSVGGVEAILDVMQKWKHDTYVLEHCCAALRYSCNDHFGNCDEVKNHNGVRSILGVMEMHPENVNVTLWCCLTLADLCKGDEELQSSATVVQGIRKVIGAMGMFSQNSRFLSSACEFLRAASVCNVENQERIVRLGGRTAIVKALETHPTDNTLTESASYALLQVQDIPDPRSSIDSSPQVGLVKRLSRDLRRSGSSSNRSNRSSKSKIGRKSLSFTARRRHGDDDEDDDHDDNDVEVPEPRATKTTSLINLQRLIPRRKSRIDRSTEPDDEVVDNHDHDVDERYDDYNEDYLGDGHLDDR